MRGTWIVLLLAVTGCATRHAPPMLAAAPDRTPLESWSLVLEQHVDEQGRIDFDALAAHPEALEHFVAFVAEAPPLQGADAIAFHVNAYNALAMYNVIHTRLRPGDLVGFFVLQAYRVQGKHRNLYDYENKVIRRLGEPRVHFALNCMVRSCPRLRREPYEARRLEEQLEDATRQYLRDERNVRLDRAGGVVWLSRIFDWYAKDFGGTPAAVIAWVNLYLEDPIPDDFRVQYTDWDWTLNEAPGPGAGGEPAPR
jgi:hypothetical protein